MLVFPEMGLKWKDLHFEKWTMDYCSVLSGYGIFSQLQVGGVRGTDYLDGIGEGWMGYRGVSGVHNLGHGEEFGQD